MRKYRFVTLGIVFAVSQLGAEVIAQPLLEDEGYICVGDDIAPSFVVTEKVVNNNLEDLCPAGEALKIVNAEPFSSIDICNGSPIPAGWVVTALNGASSVCGGALQLRITNTAGLSSVNACNGTPIPNGWVVTAVNPPSSTCGNLSVLTLVNSDPPPPPPPPPVPAAPVIGQVLKSGSSHTVSWQAPSDYPEYRLRYALERKVNDGGWHEIWKGWDNSSWSSGNVSAGTYSYRVKRITPIMSSQYSGSVSVVHGGFGD